MEATTLLPSVESTPLLGEYITASEIEVAELTKKPRLQFKCSSCDSSGKIIMGEKLDAIKAGFDKQFDSLESNIECLNRSFTKDITNLKSELKTIKESCANIDILSGKIDSAQMDIDNLKSSVRSILKLHQDIANIRAEIFHSSQAMPVTNAANMEEVIHEAQGRMLRSKNLLSFNVPESDNISADHELAIPLRPIAVTFSNNQDDHLVMRNRNKIPGRIIVEFDKTKNQQPQYKEVAAKLKTRLDSGKTTLSICDIKGVLTIVKSAVPPQLNQLQNFQSTSENF
ncbi:hypothetical protein QAD02_023596 [Eretmocerus hayati]|uniref:Uncharacterized protein n=1 Tax=Eretmocerus hayati TaxID=131215 RepID=A0ACC2PWF9_9HYME|nr:hypothetical protein QAD02_023596 [Eretmocerus hayati]